MKKSLSLLLLVLSLIVLGCCPKTPPQAPVQQEPAVGRHDHGLRPRADIGYNNFIITTVARLPVCSTTSIQPAFVIDGPFVCSGLVAGSGGGSNICHVICKNSVWNYVGYAGQNCTGQTSPLVNNTGSITLSCLDATIVPKCNDITGGNSFSVQLTTGSFTAVVINGTNGDIIKCQFN